MTTNKERSNAIRALAMDAVEQASSGHPGAPMGLADIAQVLWREYLKHNPSNPKWFDRDRFVLSNGHASMLLYAVLHLTGYDVSINDIKRFRQLHSKTAGHPEFGDCPGVETTTGPLGQGLANAVGMALAEELLAREFNRPAFDIVDHRTWVVVGDGCLMEGISHEAASLAGTLRLGKLTAIYDDNGISIDGETKHWFTEDVPSRFASYGWHVIPDVDGHDFKAIGNALQQAKESFDQPSLISCKTTIGYGAPTKAGTASTHGSPLGEEEVAGARDNLDWKWGSFEVPDRIRASWDRKDKGKVLEQEWDSLFHAYSKAHPDLAEEFLRRMSGTLPSEFESKFDDFIHRTQDGIGALETRKASGACLNFIGPQLSELIGGSADLTGSNNTQWDGAGWLWENGKYLNFGVREFGMTAIANGLALHGGFIPYTGTFLVFMEYARNAVRLAALMGIRQVLVYTHDSVGLGEDGPTHQPIEQLTNLRTTPNMSVWRPCDSVETAFAWKHALVRSHGPTAIVLTRQKTQPQERTNTILNAVSRGGYILQAERSSLEVVVIATGSEVELAVEAVAKLGESADGVRIISMPSVDTFLEQDAEYRESVLPSSTRQRVSVEAGHTDYWHKFVGLDGVSVGINRYGVSAPGPVAMDVLGMNVESVVHAIRSVME